MKIINLKKSKYYCNIQVINYNINYNIIFTHIKYYINKMYNSVKCNSIIIIVFGQVLTHSSIFINGKRAEITGNNAHLYEDNSGEQ